MYLLLRLKPILRSRKQTEDGELSLSPDVGGHTARDVETSWVPDPQGMEM